MLDTNLRGPVVLTNLSVPHLEKTKGNIVNIASTAGVKPEPHCLSYSVSKAALIQFTKCCALDLASKGIRVNAINPGSINTSIAKSSGLPKESADKFLQDYVKKLPIPRIGDAHEIAAGIAYLAGEDASFITGTQLTIDGGCLAGSA